jgi:serine/threonine protein kinase
MSTVVAGQVIDSYRIVRQIGAGGMGEVYEAVHVVLGQRVAIKILTSDFRAQPAILQRFINEARAASQINHPGIVKVYDLGQLKSGLPWLSMEYLDGQSLSTRIYEAERRKSGPLGLDAFWMIGDIASALFAAHEKGIVHRDLKPANVMVVADPATLSGDRVKVLDFGVAKLHTEQLTKRGAVLGTPSYMALEQFKSSTEVDGRADVFSLGVIAYEMLAGRRPHSGSSHYEVMGARMLQAIPPLKELVPALPDAVTALVMRMLEREVDNRPTMDQVDLEVRRALGLPPPRHSQSAGPSSGSSPAAGLVPLTFLPDRGLPTVSPAPTMKRRRRWLGGLGAALLGLACAAGGAFALWPPAAPRVEEALPPLPPAPLAPPALPAPSPAPTPTPTLLTAPPPATVPPVASGCEPPTVETCALTPPLPDELGKRLLSGIRGAGATWCSGEPLLLSGLPDAPLITAAPSALSPDLKQSLLFTLRGMLRGRAYPAKMKIVCRAR